MPNPQDISALTTLHQQIRDRVTGTARQLLDEHVPYDTMRDPEDQPETPDVGCDVCVDKDATEDPADQIPAAWPCLPVIAVADLAGIAIPDEVSQ